MMAGFLALLTVFSNVPLVSVLALSEDEEEAELQKLFDSLLSSEAVERGIEYPGERADRIAKFQEILGIVPYVNEDEEASEIVINIGDRYTIKDDGAREGTFTQNNHAKNVWQMSTQLSDGSTNHVYCANHTKGNPGSGGKLFEVMNKIMDNKLLGVITVTDARISLAEFLDILKENCAEGESPKLTASNFNDEWAFFCASQIAVWVALGDAYIEAGSKDGLSWDSSASLGYKVNTEHSGDDKVISYGSTTLSACTIYAAMKMLEIGKKNAEKWESELGHYPWLGASICYAPSSTEFTAAARKVYFHDENEEKIELDRGIAASGFFGEKTCNGKDCYILPMSAGSSTYIRKKQITITADKLPEGAFLLDASDENNHQSGVLTLQVGAASKGDDGGLYYPNGNKESYGALFYLCIPKDVAQQLDSSKTPLDVSLTARMNVDRYEAYMAFPLDGSNTQNTALVEPAVAAMKRPFKLSTNPNNDPKFATLKVIKKEDGTGNKLKDATFKIEWTEDGELQERSKKTDDNGEILFKNLPLNTEVTVTEVNPPPGHSIGAENPKKVTTKGDETQIVEVEFSNPVVTEKTPISIKINKKDGETDTPLAGCTFVVEYIDPTTNQPVTTSPVTTDTNGVALFENLPPNTKVTIKETAAPEGYALAAPVEKTTPTGSSTDTPAPASVSVEETSRAATGDFELPIQGATIFSTSALFSHPAGTAFTLATAMPDKWHIVASDGQDYYVNNDMWDEFMINLPDIMPSIAYDICNASQSIYKSSGMALPGVTGTKLYTAGKPANKRLGGRETFLAPILYATARKIAKAQRLAQAEGKSLIIYDTFRPYSVQQTVVNALDSLYDSNSTVRQNIDVAANGTSWGKGWFIAQGRSNHQRGIALDVGLCTIQTTEKIGVDDQDIEVPTSWEVLAMPTDMHELSTRAVKFKYSGHSFKGNGGYDGYISTNPELLGSLTSAAIDLNRYFTDSSVRMTPLASEWWHFDDWDACFNGANDNQGDFQVTECLSTTPSGKEGVIGGVVPDPGPTPPPTPDPDNVLVVEIENTLVKKVNIRIVKSGESGEKLKGAEFELTYAGLDTPLKGTTNDEGVYTFENLPLNTDVTITETVAPAGYEKVAPITQNTGTEGGKTIEVSLTDSKQKVNLKLIKSGSDGVQLQGATFTLTYPGLATPLQGTTGADGTYTFSDLPLNTTVTITETVVPDGYDPIEPFTHNTGTQGGQTIEIPLIDQKQLVELKVLKKDSADGKMLAGAEFSLTYAGLSSALTAVSGADGIATFKDLPLNTSVTVTETKAPEGYMKASPQTVNTGSEGNNVIELTFNNNKKKLILYKIDARTGEKLPDAIFQLDQIDGTFTTTTQPTDTEGKVVLKGDELPSGSYLVHEIHAPEGYLADSQPQTVEWNTEDPSYQEIALTFRDYKRGGLDIYKHGSEQALLAGAVFGLYKDGKLIDTLETDGSGHASKTGLEQGYYELREITPPPGYLKDDKAYGVYIDPYATDMDEVSREIHINNYKELGLRVIKIDRSTRVPLKDFVFELYKDGNYYDSGITDDNGEILFKNLQPGTYTVKEKNGPKTYIVDSPDQTIELVKGQDEIPTLTFENDKKKGYGLLKIDADTGDPIEGAVFELFQDGKSLGPYTTDATGYISLDSVEPGTYTAKEISVPDKYIKSEEVYTVEIGKDSVDPSVITITNRQKPRLTLKKIDEDTGKPLEGVVFNVSLDGQSLGTMTTQADGTIVIAEAELGTYVFEEYLPLSGYEKLRDPITVNMTAGEDKEVIASNKRWKKFKVYKSDGKTTSAIAGVSFDIYCDGVKIPGDFVTDDKGEITIEHAPAGSYKVVETHTLQEYLLNDEPINVEHTLDEDSELKIYNVKRPDLRIKKLDSITKQPLKDVGFLVQYSSEEDGALKDLGTFYTDANGYILLTKDEGHYLDEGWYTITETKAPAGYVISEPSTQKVYLAGGDDKTITFLDMPRPGLLIYKFDTVTRESLPGAVFRMTRMDSTGTGGTEIPGSPFTTDENGSVSITDLEPGTYVVEEIQSPKGYKIDPTPQTAVLTGEKQKVVSLHFGNTPGGSVLIKKLDAKTRLPLEGVKFRVTTADGTVVGNSNGEFFTEADGSILIEGLEADTALVITEIDTIPGYVVDPTPKNVTTKAGEIVTVTFTNEPKSGLLVEKYDTHTKAPLPGVEFKITTADGSLITDNGGQVSANGVYTTDEKGQILLTDIDPGNYVVTEITPLPGYSIDGEGTQSVVVKTGETYTLRFYNTKDGSAVIKKIDSVTKKPIAGVTFEIRCLSNPSVEPITDTTDSDGLITLDHVVEGTYSVKEIKTRPGYILNSEPQTMQIAPGKSVELTFENEPTGGLFIKKIDAITKEPMEGVVIEVTRPDGLFVGASNGQFYTDSAGYISIPDLEPGVYVAKEVATLPGYILDETPKRIEIKDHQTYTPEFTNQPDGTIIVQKEDSATGEPLEGVEFTITTASGEVIGDFPLGETSGSGSASGSGSGSSSGSTSGTGASIVTGQVSSNGKYVTDVNGQIIVHSVKPRTYIITETKTIDGYVLNKEPITLVVGPNDVQTVVVGNPSEGSLLLRKIDSVTKEPLAGVKFKIVNSKGELVENAKGSVGSNGVYTTDENGKIILSGLAPDSYTAKEVETIPGYVMDAAPQTVTVNTNEAKTLTFTNTPKGELIVKKIDAFTKQPLSDVTFLITHTDGTPVGTSNGRFRTDSGGYISVTDLEPGSYIVKEIETRPDYVLDPTPQMLEIKDNQTYTLTFRNQPDSSILVRKVDSQTGLPLEGVEFTITTSAGDAVSGDGGLTTTNGKFVTDANGEIHVSHLKPGTYIVTETKTLDGYVIDSTSQTVDVYENDAQTLTFKNTRMGSLIVRKIDSVTHVPLAGVTFEVSGSGETDYPAQKFITDASGSFGLYQIPAGVYSIQEISTIAGYKLDDTVQTVAIRNGETKTITLTNQPLGGLSIKKIDGVSKEPIADVLFKVTRSDGSVVGTTNGEFRTDPNGYISIPGLDAGTYIVQELETKPGYLLDNAPRKIVIKDNQVYTLEFVNQPYGGLIVRKIDAVTKKPLEGVEFKITTADGQVVDSNNGQISTGGLYTTDSNGQIVLENLAPGSYIVTETQTINGYVKNPESQTVDVMLGDVQTITFTNAPKGSLVVRKIDSVTKEPLSGVKFKITNSKGELVPANEGATSSNGIYVTDENGEIALGSLEPDVYVVTETETLPGYIMDASTKSQSVRVNTHDVQVLTFTNTPTGALVIRKLDAYSKEPLAGVLFKVTTLDGTVIGTSNGEYRTDANGYIVINDLQPGGYIVTELETISGYVLDNTPKKIEIKDHQTYTLEFANQPKGALVIQKLDSKTRLPLEGVQFQITTTSGEPVADNEGMTSSNGSYTTNKDGQIVLRNLASDTYVVTETKTLDGYVMDTKSQTVIVNPNDTQLLTFTNTPRGNLIIQKVDSVTGEPLSGATFQIEGIDGCPFVGGEYITDEHGMITLSHIPAGGYSFTEVKAKDGYRLDDTVHTVAITDGVTKTVKVENEPLGGLLIKKTDAVTKEPLSDVTFQITRFDGSFVGTANGEFTTDSNGAISLPDLEAGTYVIKEIRTKSGYILDETPHTIEVKDHQTYVLEVPNQPQGGLVINKIDAQTKEPLEGVEFLITTSAGDLVASNGGATSSNGIYITNANGQIVLNELLPGTYVVTETKPLDGYVADTNSQTVQVNESDTQTLTFTNTRMGTLVLYKVDSVTNAPLAGVTFEITGYEDNRYPVGPHTTDVNGSFRLDNVPAGVYTIQETKTLPGYKLNSTPQTVRVEGGELKKVTIKNDPLGGLLIKKMDAITKEPLSDVTFKVTHADGSVVGTSNGEYRTDSDGYISITDLDAGSYTVQEIETKKGYILDDSPRKIEIKDHQTYTLEVLNQPESTLVIQLTDKQTGEPLPNTKFTVTTATGEVVGSGITDENGEIVLPNLQPGAYIVTQTSVLDNYIMNGATQTITLDASGTRTLKFTNVRKGTLVIYKVDSKTHAPLAGVSFLISSLDHQDYPVGPHTTDGNGVIRLENIPSGIYTIQETKTLPGYELDTTVQNVSVNGGESKEITFENAPLGGLLIKKMDAVTKEPLSDVIFKVTHEDGTVVGTSNGEYRTDSDGYISIPGLDAGNYNVQEIQTKKGYILDDTPRKVTIRDQETYTLEVLNQPEGTLVVQLTDKQTGSPLPDTQFQITTPTGEVVGNYETNESGEIVVNNLQPGTYIVTQTSVLDHYTMDIVTQTIIIDASATGTLKFTNTRKGTLVIYKVDSQTRAPLAGVTFSITCSGSKEYPVGEHITDTDGTIRLEDVPAGVYTVRETKTISGYKLDTTGRNTFVKSGETAEMTFVNDPLGGLLIKKMDAVTKEPLSDVTFKVTYEDGTVVGTSNGEFRTDSDGCISIPDLDAGNYTVQEVQTKKGYLLDDTPRKVTIRDQETYVLEVLNQSEGTLVVQLTDKQTGEPLPDTKFQITTPTGKVVGDYETNENGEITINNLQPGIYTVTQTSVLDHYVMNGATQTITIDASATGTLKFTNTRKGTLVIYKVDSQTHAPLAGVTFSISSSEHKSYPVGEHITDTDGTVRLEDVPAGVYTIQEVKTIAGYKLDTTAQNVSVNNGESKEVTFQNDPLGGLLIKKMDALTKEPLSDVTFKVTRADGTVVGTVNGEYHTDSDGCIVLSDLDAGSYTVQEIQTKNGYILDDTPHKVVIQDKETYTLEVLNQPESSLVVQLTDQQTGEPLPHTKFTVATATGEVIGSYETNESGEIVINNLQPGTYVVTQTSVLDHYVMNGATQTITIDVSATGTLKFTNARKGTLVIYKVDSQTHAPLAGVTFSVTSSTHKDYPVGEHITDTDGTIRLEDVPAGVYTVQETKTISGYKLDTTAQNVSVNNGESKKLTFENAPLGGLLIKKLDAATKEPLSDVTFKVTRADGTIVGTANGEYHTDSDGCISIPDLNAGSYTVQEIQTKKGYILDDTPHKVVIQDKETYTLEVLNQPESSLVVQLTDQQTGEPLPHTKFTVVTATGEVIGSYETNESGEIVINNLQPGTYVVTQTSVLDHYVMNGATQTITIDVSATGTLKFTNTRKGTLVLYKVDSKTHAPLAGVTFSVTSSEHKDYPVGEHITDTDGTIRLEDVPAGVYTVQETKTISGYKLDTTAQNVSVNNGESKELTFENAPLGGLLIKKLDAATKEPLSDVTFKITLPDGTVVGTSNGEYTTDSRGFISIPDLQPGTYIVKEIRTKSGYILDESEKTVTIKESETYTLELTNQRKGGLVIRKIDAQTKEPLAGVEFKIATIAGELVMSNEGAISSNGIYTTDQNGEIALPSLSPNSYVVTETKALDGYVLDDTPQTVDVKEGDTQTLTFENKPYGGLLLKKMDSITKLPLSDVTFQITTSDGVAVGTSNGEYITDVSGSISIPSLAPGSYLVKEIRAKSGYVLDSTPHTVVVKDHETYTLELFNDPKGSLTIRKIDSVTKEPLAGVEFTITTASGEPLSTNEGLTSSNGRYVTNASGEIVLEKLLPGSYTVTETKALTGYALNATPQTIVVTEGDAQTLTIPNDPLGTLQIKAVDAQTKAPLSDVVFQITRPDGTFVESSNGEWATDSNGFITLSDLAFGSYVITQVRTKDGYVLDSTPRNIEIKDYQTYLVEFACQPKGGLVIRKVDSQTNEPLSGVEFQITTADGKLVAANEGATSTNGIYTTDSNGQIVLNKLEPGTYVVKETKALDGYAADSQPQTVSIQEGDIQTLTFKNTKGGTLTVKAIDNRSQEPLSGISFDVKGYTSTGYPNGTYVTDASGLFRLDGVPTGTYTVTATTTKDGYTLDTKPQTVQINAGDSKELVFGYTPLGGLVVTVKDAFTKEGLAGAVVKITTLTGTIVGNANGEFTTDASGTITLDALAPGSYLVKQLETISGYIVDDTPRTVEVTNNQTATVEILNSRKGGLVIRKIDAQTKEPLAGVEFKITTASGEFVADNEGLTSSNGIYTTDENGEIILRQLEPDSYLVTETKTLDGYVIDSTPQTVVVNATDTQTLTFTNSKQGSLVIHTLDEDTRQPVSGVVFSIKKANGEIVEKEIATDLNGVITLSDLQAGGYILTEEQTPDGYDKQNDPKTIEIKDGSSTEVTFTYRKAHGIQIRSLVKGTDQPLSGCEFIVKKINGEEIGTYTTDSLGLVSVTVANDVYVITPVREPEGYNNDHASQNVIVQAGSLASVTFEYEPLSSIRVKLVDAVTKKGIYKARILVKTESGIAIEEYTTNQDGYADLGDLLTNGQDSIRYKVEQISAPAGYERSKNPYTLRVNRGEVTELVIENTPILGQIQIVKRSSDYNSMTYQQAGSFLEGAVFQITDADTGRIVDTITSNAKGIAATNPLPLGRYYVQEKQAPKFFQINPQKVEVTLKMQGDVVRIEMYDASANVKTTITKQGNATVDAGSNMRYVISNVSNASNVPLDSFFWHDRLPTDAVRSVSFTTGKYSGRAWYKVTYKTNKNDYRTLAENLLSTNNYDFNIDSASLKLAADEYVTDIRCEFSTVPVGFKMTEAATLTVFVPAYMSGGYSIVNRADSGGLYQGEWGSAGTFWTTTISKPNLPTPSITKLPQTGY